MANTETVTSAAPGSITEALEKVRSGMRELAAADYAGLPAAVQAEVLRGMHQFGAGQAAVSGRAGWAFVVAHGYDEYAQKNMGRWHVSQGKVTRAAGYAAKAWITRYERHPAVVAAMGELDVISESWARTVTGWTSQLPQEHIAAADEIMITAARAGADLEGLGRIAGELGALLAPPDRDKGREPGRGVRVETTFEGAGVLTGDLTPACAAVVNAVLGALAQRTGPEDLRTPGERMHDGLEEAMKRLLAARLLPQRGGAPVTALVHITLADLMTQDPGSVFGHAWIRDVQARWAGERAAASVQPGDGGAWLSGDAAAAIAADAMIIPVITGTVDIAILDGLVEACLAYGNLRDGDGDGEGDAAGPAADRGAAAAELARLEKKIIGRAVALLSGPGGLASFLRRNTLGNGLNGPSLPLDVGDTGRIPPQLRRAVTIRDRHCAFPGGCDQPAAACEPHHAIHRAQHGPTKLDNLGELCWFHHHVVVHQWGWTVTIEPDGTMTARKPDGTLFNHGPPAQAG